MQQNKLQTMLGITKCGRVNYKVRQGLQRVAGITNRVSACKSCGPATLIK